MPRRKPVENPAPPNFEESYGDLLIDSPAERKRIARLLPRISDYRAFRRDVVAVSHWTHMELYEQKRFDRKAICDALDDLREKLESTQEALRDLGYDASEALKRRAERRKAQRPGRSDKELRQGFQKRNQGSSGASNVQSLVRALDDGVLWAAEARALIRRDGRGRPRDWAAENAMYQLIETWEKQTEKRPTIATDSSHGKKTGPFLAFADAILTPIYRANGLRPPRFAPLAQKLLYPPRESELR